MTAGAFADLLGARPSGSGKWQARCPAHADTLPSLSIREGQDGRVLVHCFAGCTSTAILAKLGLGIGDLFPGPPPTRAQLATLQADRRRLDDAAREQRRDLRDAWNAARKWQAVVDILGDKLAGTPNEQAPPVAKLFHAALDRLRLVESVATHKEALARVKRT
jgi:hypothetical protein